MMDVYRKTISWLTKAVALSALLMVFAAPPVQAQTCTFSIDLYDSFGDGWDVGRLDVLVNNVVVLNDITFATGYGPVNSAGVPANIALVIGRKALLAGAQPVDPQIDTAIQRASDFFAWYVNKGSIPYGEHHPGALIESMGLAAEVEDRLLAGTALEWLDVERSRFQ